MVEQEIKYKRCCPKCGAKHTFKIQIANPNNGVKCQVCHTVSPFCQWRQVNDEHSATHYRNQVAPQKPQQEKLAVLRHIATGNSYDIQLGKTVIGRQSSTSSADIQINTGDGRRMSREHVILETKWVNGKYVYKLSLCKEKINDTYVVNEKSREKILFGDVIYLKPNDVIELPDAKLLFEIHDDEKTAIA